MISTGPNGSGSKATSNFFMANIWSGSASNIAAAVSSPSSRAFQHSRLLKSGSEESLNSVLLQDDSKNSLERDGKVVQKVKRNEKLIRRRCRSQNDAADTVSEHEFVVSPDHLKNNTCCLRDHESGEVVEDGYDEEENCEDGSITETSKSKCDAPVNTTKRLANLKKNERSKQKELLASILDDTDDIDQLEYFDDNEINSSSSPVSTSSSSSSSSPPSPSTHEQLEAQQVDKNASKQTPKNSENVAIELFRALSIKSTNMWWRWSGNKGSKDSSSSVEETTVTGSDLLELEMNSMQANKAKSAEQPPASPTKSESTIMSKLKNFAKLSEEKEKMEKFTFYTDEPDQKPNLMLFKGCNEIYKVKSSEETLRSIAAGYKTTPAEIKSLNHLSQDHIFIGQLLLIPLIVETEQNLNDKNATN